MHNLYFPLNEYTQSFKETIFKSAHTHTHTVQGEQQMVHKHNNARRWCFWMWKHTEAFLHLEIEWKTTVQYHDCALLVCLFCSGKDIVGRFQLKTIIILLVNCKKSEVCYWSRAGSRLKKWTRVAELVGFVSISDINLICYTIFWVRGSVRSPRKLTS